MDDLLRFWGDVDDLLRLQKPVFLKRGKQFTGFYFRDYARDLPAVWKGVLNMNIAKDCLRIEIQCACQHSAKDHLGET